jgi:predicted SAM-dependent methyltransferase
MRILNYFELNSFFGRVLCNRRPPIKAGKNYLNLGSGPNEIENWINADFFPNLFPHLSRIIDFLKPPYWMLDLRYPINCDSDVFDGIYCGHTLEHLTMRDAINLLKEVYRILKPGCWLRINVPDLGEYVKFYQGEKVDKLFHNYSTGAEAIHDLTQEWGHLSVWDETLLTKKLQTIGFVNIRRVDFGKEGTDLNLIREQEVRRWETLVIEVQKPIIL